MKKYMKISLLFIFPLMMHGAEKLNPTLKSSKRISGPRSLASSDGAVTQQVTEPKGRDLARSAPIAVPSKKEIEFSPNIYLGLGGLSERKNSYTPGNDSGR